MSRESNREVVVLDTCVLAPMPLCDTLLRLAEEPAFYVPKWTAEILRELRRTLLRMGYTAVQADRRLVAMETAFPDAAVNGYEDLVAAMKNDPKDRHVLAAAVRCGAHRIVTANVKHFPPAALRSYDLDLLTPDQFLIHQFGFNEELFRDKLMGQAVARGVSLDQLLERLSRAAPIWVGKLR